MFILALESSSNLGSIAVADGPRLVAEVALNPLQRSAQSMAPAIRELLEEVGRKITQVELVAVSVGPGSFTGLRVGIVTAKTLAYALGARCVGVSTLEVIAAQAHGDSALVSVAMDAQRGQVFTATYTCTTATVAGDAHESGLATTCQCVAGPDLIDNEKWLGRLEPGVAASGPALARLAERVPPGVVLIDKREWSPRAATVAALAWARHQQGRYDDVWKLAPLYLRKSAAEEKEKLMRSSASQSDGPTNCM